MSLWGKIIAGMLVLTGAQGFGLALRQEMKCILYHLNEQKQMLFYIMREISFLHRPMQEIFLSLADRLQKPYNVFLKDIADNMDNGSGRSLQEIWDEELDTIEKNRCYPKVITRYLRQMKRCFCCEEDEMQKEAFAMLCEELEEERKKMQKSMDEKGRLIKTLSFLAGILCIMIFV